MPSIDMGLDQLLTYSPPTTAQPDFDSFWQRTLAETREYDLMPVLDVMDYPVRSVLAHRLSFAGFGGHRINGLYLLPRGCEDKPVPVVLVVHGYTGGAGMVHMHLPWVQMGCAVISVDTRGQGGDTGEPGGYDGGSVMGWMTNGILDPEGYYYRRAYTDCVRAVDFACSRPEIDAERICVTGGSQGGGLSIAVAGLDNRVSIVMPDVPFLCHFQRAVDITPAGPYPEIANYLAKYPGHVDDAFRTLSYFDGMNLAARIAPSSQNLWSVGLWDDVCPPSTVFAAYNACPAESKDIAIYPYNKHEGGHGWQRERQIAFLADALNA
ncbi:MAG: alpha/beta fold hydrolase [Armatimonadetes bacterium]|nr:alpha/beta fold hydrolase [Armatimonadota bacterium]